MSSPVQIDAFADRAQRERALDPATSFIVQAPAGAGKTELLIQRFLRLLALVPQPESIVAITFTRKAAGEMQDRLMTALRRAAEGIQPDKEHERITHELAGQALARDRAQSWHLMENPARLRIQTIDSLCASLTRQMPWLARLGGQAEIVEEPDLLYEEAARRTLQMVEQPGDWQPALERVLLHLDNNAARVQKLLVAMLGIRDQWLELAVQCDEEGQRTELERAMANATVERLRRADVLMPQDIRASFVELARYAAANLEGTNPQYVCARLAAMPACDPEQLQAWLGLVALVLTKDGIWRSALDKRCGFPAPSSARTASDRQLFTTRKQQCAQLIERLAAVDGLQYALAFIRRLPPGRYTDEQWSFMRSLFTALKLAVANLKQVFREEGAADFCEIAQAAREAWGDDANPTDLTLALDAQVQHILVDEFQDTSMGQHELLRRLTAGWERGDGRTLFVVGDPMQSIYRFRQAQARDDGRRAGRVDLDEQRVSTVALSELRGLLRARVRHPHRAFSVRKPRFGMPVAERGASVGKCSYENSVRRENCGTCAGGSRAWIIRARPC